MALKAGDGHGGDEFAAILSARIAASAQIVAERLCETVSMLAVTHPTTTFGHATISGGCRDLRARRRTMPSSLPATADSALYKAKSAGRGGWRAQEFRLDGAGS